MPQASVFVADTDNHVIRAIASDGTVSTLAGAAGAAGSADGLGGAARFNRAVRHRGRTRMGAVFVTDQGSHTLRSISPGGVVDYARRRGGQRRQRRRRGRRGALQRARRNRVRRGRNGLPRGPRQPHDPRDHGRRHGVDARRHRGHRRQRGRRTARPARFDHPTGVCLHPLTGDLLVADRGNRRVRRRHRRRRGVDAAGDRRRARRSFADPVGVAVDANGDVFVANESAHHSDPGARPRARRARSPAPPARRATSTAPASTARLFLPRSLAAGALGTLVVADSGSHSVRLITYEATASECAGAAIVAESAGQVVMSGQTATVSVTASGTPPLAYQWYAGQPGDTSSPIAGATAASYATGPLAADADGVGAGDERAAAATTAARSRSRCAPTRSRRRRPRSRTPAAPARSTSITDAPCPWTATASADWVTFPAGARAPARRRSPTRWRPTRARRARATITVAGQTHTVTQALLPRYLVSSVAHAPGASAARSGAPTSRSSTAAPPRPS